MSVQRDDENTNQPQSLLLRADEVDSGTTIPSPSNQQPLSALTPVEGFSTATARPKPPPRPVLRREGSGPPPPPPQQPPPAPPPMQPENATDSLSLPQLKQLVSQFPKTEQRAYAYHYREAEDFVTEVDEWFHYAEIEQDREYLLATREIFEQRWKLYCQSELKSNDATWIEVSIPHRESFMTSLVSELSEEDTVTGSDALACIYYVLTGVWSITAGLELECQGTEAKAIPNKSNAIQMEWMHKAADLFISKNGLKPIYQRLRKALEQTHGELSDNVEEETDSFFNDSQYREISLCMSCMYLTVESARVRPHENAMTTVRDAFMSLEPNLSVYLVSVISKLRWDESYNIPLMHALQLLWKLTLLCFGDLKNHLEKIKGILQPRVDPFSSEAARPILTASPLDYHLFRQEITSKYPAYNPPPPLIPLELEQKTMLPPAASARHESFDHFAGQASTTTGSSILHQPVHIATPAPSPPPSPAGPGGKAGKKQNYQTNQNFPFLYPPLDSASNNIGGKGTTELQDATVGRKWDGSDIPASIIEAGELFASRMRMTRAMRQLWTERDLFMKYDRGWDADLPSRNATSVTSQSGGKDKESTDDLADPELQDRMKAVDDFFHYALPDLQSLIIVMMKVMLTNVQDIAVRNGVSQEGQTNGLNRNKSNSNMAQGQALPIPPPPPRPNEIHLDDLDNIRSREISQKAISAFLFLLLKWSKTSHVLKFEYITQLLLDSNYVQLTLKFFAHQNLEDLVAFSYDRTDLSFWHYCHVHSDHPPLSPTSPDSHPQSEADNEHDGSSLDDAIPPPIQRHRRSPTSSSDSLPTPSVFASPEPSQTTHQDSAYPTVDELGNPIGPVPQTPIEEFSARQFQTSIHLLRLLQKLSRAKSHRILLLVQFKSSQILRRILRVPDTLLRLYVLKLFKSQVPYCGRKWRQSNMRVITAIYLHCRPELRDEWLAGMHDSNVEGEVDEAVPLEWALRGLTYWWMKRTYPDIMKLKQARRQDKGKSATHPALAGEQADSVSMEDPNADESIVVDGGQEIDEEERDFFQRELDAMGWGLAGLGFGAGEDVGFGEEAPGVMSAFPTGVSANGMNGDHQGWEHVNMGQANIETWS